MRGALPPPQSRITPTTFVSTWVFSGGVFFPLPCFLCFVSSFFLRRRHEQELHPWRLTAGERRRRGYSWSCCAVHTILLLLSFSRLCRAMRHPIHTQPAHSLMKWHELHLSCFIKRANTVCFIECAKQYSWLNCCFFICIYIQDRSKEACAKRVQHKT